ncbi:NAD-dependent epimerase/dehydratase family protein [Streptantibioticus ferralitis]|uniref:NAD(P)-dependent oxidoreductase n=1 Tax=Streptantibioticus ferralitis TaxID=236510 RepID=A0ABT5YYE3_9ACTN|nr:NAD(P)-dependent oxidoreductase [Streptantibioticus ferralitis]MDF2256513.1 NAD(P)-dependent oxidoreductase [Streptantibioticus ferralitis]
MTPPRPRRVAVLGGTGSVGRHVCATFAAQGHEVIVVARKPAPHAAPYRFVPLDLVATGGAELAAFLTRQGIDTVVDAFTGWGPTDAEMRLLNVRPVEHVVDALRRLPNRPRLVHVGTLHEYGPVPEGSAIHEELPPAPDSLYARVKLAASETVLDAAGPDGVDGVVVRLANTLGPYPAAETFLGSLARRLHDTDLSAGIELTISDARRDYVDVRDAAEAIVRAALLPEAPHLLNIGSGTAVGVRTLVGELLRAAGLPADTVRETGGVVHSHGGDWTRADISLATSVLGWRPRFTVAESMTAMWDSLGA